MDEKEFQLKMQDCANLSDPEAGHSNADKLMCEVLSELGYKEGVDIFNNMLKWYS